MVYLILKRIFDFIFSALILILILPLLLFLSLVIFLNVRESPLFVQNRNGLGGKEFKIIKFKTMKGIEYINGMKVPDVDRIFPLGKFMRKFSLDELPQFLNVAKGDMSFVGPRPLLTKYMSLYSAEQNRRHNVRPGITGWAQVNGRNNVSWKEKFEFDVYYVDHISLALDLKIVFLTIIKVFAGSDVSKEGNATTETFNGNN